MDKPASLQDLRQVQYNKWCKRNGVYNGSYLSKEPKTLLKKGWSDITNPKCKIPSLSFKRKSSGQTVRFDSKEIENGKKAKNEHYHWDNTKPEGMSHDKFKEIMYRDRYGKICDKNSKESHLAPLDKDFVKL